MENIRKIIIRTPNFLGDTINTTPCIQLIKQEYPNAELVVVCPEHIKAVFRYDDRISKCITFSMRKKKSLSTYWHILRKVRKEKGDLGIIFVNTLVSALLFAMAGVKCKIGYAREGRGKLLNFKLPFNRNKHYINRYASLFNEFTGNKYTFLPDLYLPISGKQTFHFDNNHKTIGLYLGGMNKGFRRYPDSLSIALLSLLHQKQYNLVLIGDKKDNEKHENYARTIASNLINLTGKTNVEDLFNTIAHLDALITIDSAALHTAAALKVPFVALLGLSTSPTSNILPKVSFGKALKIENNMIREEDYMENLKPEIVMAALEEVLAQ